jgi:hypothetical protein
MPAVICAGISVVPEIMVSTKRSNRACVRYFTVSTGKRERTLERHANTMKYHTYGLMHRQYCNIVNPNSILEQTSLSKTSTLPLHDVPPAIPFKYTTAFAGPSV